MSRLAARPLALHGLRPAPRSERARRVWRVQFAARLDREYPGAATSARGGARAVHDEHEADVGGVHGAGGAGGRGATFSPSTTKSPISRHLIEPCTSREQHSVGIRDAVAAGVPASLLHDDQGSRTMNSKFRTRNSRNDYF